MRETADIIVVGGGLVGVAAAVSLARLGLETLHLAPAAPPDRRSSALMRPSVDFLRQAGLIERPDAIGHKLSAIRLIDATARLLRAPETLFEAREMGLDAFGWNFANTELIAHFARAAPGAGLTVHAAPVTGYRRDGGLGRVSIADGTTLSAPLVIGADGKKSFIRAAAGIAVRTHDFAQSALVCDLELGRPLGGVSIEFHYPQGPFTLVPAGGHKANLVWIDETHLLRAAQASSPDSLLAHVRQRAQNLFGPLALASPSAVFPLGTLSPATAGADGTALIGEAAHAFPPIGAQGLNLGLRDVADLLAAVAAHARTAPDWGERVSADYAARRRADLARTGTLVDTLFRSLLSDMLPSQALRASGLWALKTLPPLRRHAFVLGMGTHMGQGSPL